MLKIVVVIWLNLGIALEQQKSLWTFSSSGMSNEWKRFQIKNLLTVFQSQIKIYWYLYIFCIKCIKYYYIVVSGIDSGPDPIFRKKIINFKFEN